MTRNPITDARRLAAAVDRLDDVSASDRQAAAKHVFDVCVYHVTRVRKTHPGPHHRGHGRLPTQPHPTPTFVFDLVYPHIYHIARRLDRAMRYAETSPHPSDAAALIVAVDAQGALAALFAVAQNAGVDPSDLELLALPLRKRSAPALLRTLFSPDMRVANAAKKALRQVIAIASCQHTPWMSTIRSALSLRTATSINRSAQLRNLLTRLADFLHLVVRQAASANTFPPAQLPRKRSSRSSLGSIMVRPRPSLISERRAAERYSVTAERPFFKDFFRKKQAKPISPTTSRVSRVTTDTDMSDRVAKRRFNKPDSTVVRRIPRADSIDDMHSTASGILSTGGSCPGSILSSVTESAGATTASRSLGNRAAQHTGGTIKRDAATAMYIFERLLAKRTNPELHDRVHVITTLAEIASTTFSGQFAHSHKIEHVREYSDAMTAVFARHGQNIYSIVLDVLFRPVREAEANRIGVFSFHEAASLVDIGGMDTSNTQRKLAHFPQSAICLPNMDCTTTAARSCNSMLKVFLRFVPSVCAQRLALLTGTINSAFLHCTEALNRTSNGCKWDVSKIVSAVDALKVLVPAIPSSVESALDLIIREPVMLRLVIETCIRSVSATGRLLAQNTARPSAPKLSDEGTLDSLRSWQALIKVIPGTSSWSGTPSYSSSILFLAQVSRRAALICVVQGYRREKYNGVKVTDDEASEERLGVVKDHAAVQTFDEDNLDEGNTESDSPDTFGLESDGEILLASELHDSVIAMINIPGTSPGDIFFELYRTVVYLYANDLKKQHRKTAEPVSSAGTPAAGTTVETEDSEDKITPVKDDSPKGPAIGLMGDKRTQSDEDANGVLVENIAVDGQLPSRALRRAVMGSELDLGEYFDGVQGQGQPPSLQHVSMQYTGLAVGMHTFEEFAHALAIIISILSKKSITDNFENPEEAATMIARDVQRSGSSYLKKVHKRAKSILRRGLMSLDGDWRSVKYEERIRKLEEEVASLKSLVQHSLEESVQISRRKSLPKILGLSGSSYNRNGDELHEIVCGPSRCFCVA